jgi:hypothetical protein
VVHHCLSSIVIFPSCLLFPGHLSFVVPLASSSLYSPGAPTIHLMSSCLSVWGWVLCWSLSMSSSFIDIIVHVTGHSSSSSPSSSFVIVCCHPCHHHLSSFDGLSLSSIPIVHPSLLFIAHPLVVHHCPSSRHPSPRPTHGPPHEQLLMRLGASGASSSIVYRLLSLSLVVGRWSLVVGRWSLVVGRPPFVISPSFVIFVIWPWCTRRPPDEQLLLFRYCLWILNDLFCLLQDLSGSEDSHAPNIYPHQ